MSDHARSAQSRTREGLRFQANRTACQLIKGRARIYAQRPQLLETVFPGLSSASPDTLIAVAAHLMENARSNPRRWFGFGGEISILNAKAVRLLGRTLRRNIFG
jgi:hypothetical protein